MLVQYQILKNKSRKTFFCNEITKIYPTKFNSALITPLKAKVTNLVLSFASLKGFFNQTNSNKKQTPLELRFLTRF